MWKNNTNWRLLESGVVQAKSSAAAWNNLAASTAVVERTFTEVETQYPGVWQRYSDKQSSTAAIWLRANFLENASTWLQKRPVETLVSDWSNKAWTSFKEFYEASGETAKTSSMSTEDFRLQFTHTAREELFHNFPEWWTTETKLRANDLFRELEIGQTPDATVASLANSVKARNLFEVQRGFGWQEKL